MHVGVIGGGAWSRVHLAALAASPHVESIALAARNPVSLAELANAFGQLAVVTEDYAQLLDDDRIGVVTIALPHDCHAAVTQAALAAGKHVICEKPAALDLAEFDASVAAAREYDRRLLVVMNQLYNPVYLRVRQMVDAGDVGRPFLSVENSFTDRRASYRRAGDWRTTIARAGGGMLIDGGYHMVYRHLYTLAGQGWPEWVLADTAQLALDDTTAPDPAYGEDFVAATVGYAGRLRIQWAHGWTLRGDVQRHRQSFLAGSAATLELTDLPKCPLILQDSTGRPREIDIASGPVSGNDTTHACLLDYIDQIATGRVASAATLELARATLAAIQASYASGRSGARVSLDSLSG